MLKRNSVGKMNSQALPKKKGKVDKKRLNPPSNVSMSESSDTSESSEQKPDVYKYVKPSEKSFGFIGLGMMGQQIVANLLKSGHNVTVWNKTISKCDAFAGMGAKIALSPHDLVVNCDITFCCVSDADASEAVLFGENGVLQGFDTIEQSNQKNEKAFVEMSSIDPITSVKAASAVEMKKGAYLEAMLSGTSKDAKEGNLLICAAGNRKLFSECETCFHAIGRHAFYLSCGVGEASKMNLILNSLPAVMCVAVAEAMTLIEKMKLEKGDFLECLKNGPLSCEMIMDNAQKMAALSYEKGTTLKYAQKDIMLSLMMSDHYSQPMPITAAANEIYKLARQRNLSNEDMSAIHKIFRY